jgi:hypothetical protein
MVRITVTGLVDVPGKEDERFLKLMTPPEALSCLAANGHDLSYKLGDEGKPQRKPKASKEAAPTPESEGPPSTPGPEGSSDSDTPPGGGEPSAERE